ncbi:MAG: M23 family metallopeptidase [Veillonellales bacterium]
MVSKLQRPDRREYTLIIVPHRGQAVRSIRIPIRMVKIGLAALCAVLFIVAGTFVNYQHTVSAANSEKAELERLRQVNDDQGQQLEELGQATAALQQDMNRLDALDNEIRRLVNSDEASGASRGGIVRSNSGLYHGQGGPMVTPSVQDLTKLVRELQQGVQAREASLTSLRDAVAAQQVRLAATPSIWPAGGDVTSRFGWRSSPWGRGSDWHPGIDIANSAGTPIVATADGIVTESGWNSGGYGNMVQIDHGNGIVTIYGHTSQVLVSRGMQVKKGEVIAYMGSTGLSTGSHVHYEVRVNGTAVNPASFL